MFLPKELSAGWEHPFYFSHRSGFFYSVAAEVFSWRERMAAWQVIISSFAPFCLSVTRQSCNKLVIWPWEAIRSDKKRGHIWETGCSSCHAMCDTYLQLTDVKLCGYPHYIILLSHWLKYIFESHRFSGHVCHETEVILLEPHGPQTGGHWITVWCCSTSSTKEGFVSCLFQR